MMTANESGWNLLEKTEIRVERVGLDGANLSVLARAVAGALGLPETDVLVIDARDGVLAFDILRNSMDARQLVGKRGLLLRAIGAVEGVTVSDATRLCAEGMLGWLAFDQVEGAAALERSREMIDDINAHIRRRAVVFPTGDEVAEGNIEDTNTPMIRARLEREGFVVDECSPLRDDRELIEGALRAAVFDEGYGLVVSTGGVGAETKDCTIEALQGLDASAASPYICRFEKGRGRHAKDGVRIAVGRAGSGILIALPGPNDEAALGLEAAVAALRQGREPEEIARAVADVLRRRLVEKMHGAQGSVAGC